jgi:hypothetical protein
MVCLVGGQDLSIGTVLPCVPFYTHLTDFTLSSSPHYPTLPRLLDAGVLSLYSLSTKAEVVGVL